MSAIWGIYNLDKAPVNPEYIALMGAKLNHRGQDKTLTWFDSNIAIGHHLRFATPEDKLENLPYEDDVLVLSADCRIYNREELAIKLSISPIHINTFPDSYFIHKSYEKWGRECVYHLKGAFAFAIWDKRERLIFCVRDHFGLKPLYYYYQPNRVFAFASEIDGLLSLPFVNREINDSQVYQYLDWSAGGEQPTESTFFTSIKRVLPAYSFSIGSDRIEKSCFWKIDWEKYAYLKKNSDYIEALSDAFSKSVQANLRTNGKVGALLSGGLDSSSVCAIAQTFLNEKNRTLKTLYLEGNTVDTDEQYYVDLMVEKFNFEHTNLFLDTQDVISFEKEDFSVPPISMFPKHQLETLSWFQNNDIDCVLSGYGGDEVMGYGFEYLDDLFQKKDYGALKNGIVQQLKRGSWYLSENNGEIENVSDKEVEAYVLREYIYKGVFSSLEELKSTLRTIYFLLKARNLTFSTSSKVLSYKLRRKIERDFLYSVGSKLVDRNKSDNLENERDLYRFEGSTQLISRQQSILNTYTLSYTEEQEEIHTKHNMEIRTPFHNFEVMCLALLFPKELNFFDGYGRGALRHMFNGLLPEKNSYRVTKSYGDDYFFDVFRCKYLSLHPCENMKKYVSIEQRNDLNHNINSKRIVESNKNKISTIISTFLNLNQWLLNYEKN